MLELVRGTPNWLGALSVAVTRPPGTPERRQGDDHWRAATTGDRPHRITDDLAWLREAYADPEPHGLHPVLRGKATAAWEPDEAGRERLTRLRDRLVLEAAGFELTDTPSRRRGLPRFERKPAHTRAR